MSAEPRPETMSRCLSCQEPIHPKAKLCKTCKSYQDWRRHFDFSAVVLSLLVALISVISAVGPRIISWLPPFGSRLEVKSSYYSTDAIVLIVETRAIGLGILEGSTWCYTAPVPTFTSTNSLNSSPNTNPITTPAPNHPYGELTSTWAHQQIPVERFPHDRAAKYPSFYRGICFAQPRRAFPEMAPTPLATFAPFFTTNLSELV
jgi:hypothetical protein